MKRLLVVEVTDALAEALLHKDPDNPLRYLEYLRVHELPSAEELGRVAHEAQKCARQRNATYSYKEWGQAILDALTKRTEGRT